MAILQMRKSQLGEVNSFAQGLRARKQQSSNSNPGLSDPLPHAHLSTRLLLALHEDSR